MSDLVRYRRDGRIAHVELARPAKLNALNDAMIHDLRAALEEFDADDEAHVAIISGDGRAFCSGADVQERQLRPREELRRLGGPEGRGARIGEVLLDTVSWKPVIAAVHGHVVGAGIRLALHCELVVADVSAKFRLAEVGRGLDAGPHWALLKDLAGGSFATEVALTSREWTAAEAFDRGVVARVVAQGQHVVAAEALALEIADAPPGAVRAMVETRRGALRELELRAWISRPRGLHLSEEFRASAEAFVNRRDAQ